MTTDHIPEYVTHELRNKTCWYVSHGGVTSPSFKLAIGEKIRRRTIVTNPAHPEDFRQYMGEANLLVWCTWRLGNANGLLVSSDASEEEIDKHMNKLVGKAVLDVTIQRPAWDMTLFFSGDLVLELFCDQVAATSSVDGNWELWQENSAVLIGRCSTVEILDHGPL